MDLRRRSTIIFLALGIILSGVSKVSAHEISGQVKMAPPYPEPKLMKVHKKVQDSCAEEQISQSLQVSSQGGVANTVIWLEGNFSSPLGTTTNVVLNQSQCNFQPHVALIPPGGRLRVLNSDPLAHDVRAFEEAKMLFRLDMDTKAKPQDEQFEKQGIYTIRCGLHPWMHAFVVQAAHPFYAVSNAEGKFSLGNVPAGKHRLHLWHETLGETVLPLEVAGPVNDFSYTYKTQTS